MSTQLGALVLTVLCISGVWIGLRFRAGGHRAFVVRYRDSSLPSSLRNMPIFAPIVAGLALPLLVGIDLAVFLGRSSDLKAIALRLGLPYLLLSFALVAALIYVQPRWLVPRWLRQEDEAVHYQPPKPSWEDRALLVVGLASGFAGLALPFTS